MVYFFGICITTNKCEGLFSVLDSIFRFKGKRTVESWIKILDIWFYQKLDIKFYCNSYFQDKIRTTIGVRNGLNKINFMKIDNPKLHKIPISIEN